MLDQHKCHLVSTCETVAQHLAEVRQVVTSGRSPTGALMRPLPEPARTRLLTRLDELAARVDEVRHSLMPAVGREATHGGNGPGAARMWVGILLRTVEQLIRDLLPEHMERQYGDLQPGEAARVQAAVEELLGLIREAIRVAE